MASDFIFHCITAANRNQIDAKAIIKPRINQTDTQPMRLPRILAAILSLCGLPLASAAESVNYSQDVAPILNQYCVGCHTQDAPEGGYVMENYAAQMKGGEHGVAITPGSASSSRLILMLQGKLQPTMPPANEPRPTAEEIETLVTWVEQGANGPDGPPQLKRMLNTPSVPPNLTIARPITATAVNYAQQARATARYGQIMITRPNQPNVSITAELNKINSLSFSRDGEKILVSSGRTGAFGTATVYSTVSGEPMLELVGHRDVLYAAEYSPDESLIATAGYDQEIVLWNAVTGEAIRKLSGHNGAIFDLCFSTDGKLLISASADETVKIWDVATGARVETLGQPEGEVLAVAMTTDDRYLLAAGTDNRIRIWQLPTSIQNSVTPLIATRYVDDSAITHINVTKDGTSVVLVTEAGNVKILDTAAWNLYATLEPLADTATSVDLDPKNQRLTIALMDGTEVTRTIPPAPESMGVHAQVLEPIFLDLGQASQHQEQELPEQSVATEKSPNASKASDTGYRTIPRNSEVTGIISQEGEKDLYRWRAHRGEQWAIDVDADKDSKIDPIVTILDDDLNPVLRTRLQATRESYFTFRGKDSMQVGDFRLFNWEEMHLNDYLYSSGEVTRLWLYPRGPDSGYNVYPNEGNRWTYFGTSHSTHALGEPAYVVTPLGENEEPTANGLPTFEIYYENDDDPHRQAGKNSRLIFTSPKAADYYLRITDTRGMGGEAFTYVAKLRPAVPSYIPSLNQANGNIHRGTGREFTVRIHRLDGFEGEVSFDIPNLPSDFITNLPVTIEAGQSFATGCLWLPEDATAWEGKISPDVIATADILGKRVERNLGPVGNLTLVDRPNVIPTVHPIGKNIDSDELWTLQVARGATVTARVTIDRKDGFTSEVSFGKEDAGRNTTHGVYVDNIGLNGLLVRENESEREFFITADPIAQVGKRLFHLRAGTDGGITTKPIILEVLP